MRVLTRQQHVLAAQSVPLQAGKRILTPEDLEALASLVALNPALGAFVDALEVNFRSAFSLAALRKTFRYLHNLTDLILVVPALRSPTALRGVFLPCLQYFRTNLPHRTVHPFIDAHPSITELDLVGEGSHPHKKCPLSMATLDDLQTLSGPSSCVPYIALPGLSRLCINLGTSTSGGCAALRAIPAPLCRLYQLTIDIRDDDDDILHSIAYACPGVRKLKLIEQGSPTTGRSLRRRAWNDTVSWASALKKLPELEELLLRTPAPLVRRQADLTLERRVVLSWVEGRRRSSRRADDQPHPMIYHIGIWYGAGRFGGGCVTHWSKPSGVWERQVSTIDPGPDYMFM
ncbi:hypothetical protein FKP32DRAFT_1681304 [Trametes sanguinea]|nr:hypothetical protein FKP32DRAFT_1681304 [Trametes sanguinea]